MNGILTLPTAQGQKQTIVSQYLRTFGEYKVHE